MNVFFTSSTSLLLVARLLVVVDGPDDVAPDAGSLEGAEVAADTGNSFTGVQGASQVELGGANCGKSICVTQCRNIPPGSLAGIDLKMIDSDVSSPSAVMTSMKVFFTFTLTTSSFLPTRVRRAISRFRASSNASCHCPIAVI
jgi:hypothetical protein